MKHTKRRRGRVRSRSGKEGNIMDQNSIIQLCERLAAVETKVNILMFIQGLFASGVIGMAITRIFKNGKNGGK